MKNIIVFVSMLFLLSACTDQAPAPLPQYSDSPLTGLWTLYSMEQRDSTTGTWQPYRNGMQGYLLYDGRGHMALHLSTLGYEQFRPEFPNFNPQIPQEALQHLTNSYHYLGTYTVDEAKGQVTHTKLAHSNPSEWGLESIRNFRFKGDTLVMTPEEEENAGLRVRWGRIKIMN